MIKVEISLLSELQFKHHGWGLGGGGEARERGALK